MPRSKRSKVVSLTKTDKKTREWKENTFSKIRDSVDSYDYVHFLQHQWLIFRFGYSVSRICEIHIWRMFERLGMIVKYYLEELKSWLKPLVQHKKMNIKSIYINCRLYWPTFLPLKIYWFGSHYMEMLDYW